MTRHPALDDLNGVLEEKDEEIEALRSSLDRAREAMRRRLDEISDLRRQLNELETATTQPMPYHFEDADTVHIGGKNYYAEKPSNNITEEFLDGISLGQQTIEENNRLKVQVQDLETQLQSAIELSTHRLISMELLNRQLAEKDRQLSVYGAYIEDGKLKIQNTKVFRSATYIVDPL